MAMDRAIHDYLVEGNATNGKVGNLIDFCLMLAEAGSQARYEWYSYALVECRIKKAPLRF